eukprot:147848_1
MRCIFVARSLLIVILFRRCANLLLDSNGNERFCFDESERVNLVYQDFPDERVEDIPTYSILTGGWDSQHVVAMIGYILFREKLGVDASFYPSNNYTKYWDYATNYPYNFEQWIDAEDLDIIFEYSGSYQTPTMKQYEFDGSISMKSNGVMLTHGFYIPDYLFETYPTAAVYAKWKDPDWRQYIVNATWSQQVLDVDRSMNKPMIWHSLASYIDSQQMEKMNDYHDLDLHFNYSGSETSNTERLLGLYNASVPFICYSYSPMLLPALISLQRVYFPDNPTGMYDDECMSEGRCDMPDDAYRVLWRTDAMTRSWTEVQMFLMRFHLDRGKVESVIGIAYKYSANNTDDFFQATCQWLKNNTATWNDWIVPIQRWKCGANGELCATESVSSLQVTIYGLSGIITVLLVVWIMYKLVGFCKEFQEAFVNTDVDESNALIQKEKRRIMISIFTDVAALSISVIDFVTDVIALLAILVNKEEYSDGFLVLYFLLTLFAAFACTAHMVVTARNTMKDVFQLKTGVLQLFEEFDMSPTRSQSIATNKILPSQVDCMDEFDCSDLDDEDHIIQEREIKKLRFKLQILSKSIRQHTVTIFVAIIEDVPFYIVNTIALIGSKSTNTILLVSLSINAVSIGFKLCVTKEFFAHLIEKSEVKESIMNLEEVKERQKTKISVFNQRRSQLEMNVEQ